MAANMIRRVAYVPPLGRRVLQRRWSSQRWEDQERSPARRAEQQSCAFTSQRWEIKDAVAPTNCIPSLGRRQGAKPRATLPNGGKSKNQAIRAVVRVAKMRKLAAVGVPAVGSRQRRKLPNGGKNAALKAAGISRESQRQDVDLERWVAEIKLRAVVRIGELSRELETAPASAGPGRGKKGEEKPLPTNGKSFKADALRSAGISRSAAYRAEQIADQAPVNAGRWRAPRELRSRARMPRECR